MLEDRRLSRLVGDLHHSTLLLHDHPGDFLPRFAVTKQQKCLRLK
jgi:hypothetical protein